MKPRIAWSVSVALGIVAVSLSALAAVPCSQDHLPWESDGNVCGGDATIASGPDGDGTQAVGISLNHGGDWAAHVCRSSGLSTTTCQSTCSTFDTSDDGTSAVDATGCGTFGASVLFWIEAQ